MFTPEQKQDTIPKLTDTTVSLENESMPPFAVVILEVEEIKSGDLDFGGVFHRTAEVKAG